MNPTHLLTVPCLQQITIYLSLYALFGVRKDLKFVSLRPLPCYCCFIFLNMYTLKGAKAKGPGLLLGKAPRG